MSSHPTWLPSNTEFRTYNNSFDGDILAKNGGLEDNINKIIADDQNSEIYLEQTDSKTFSSNKNAQIDLSNETKEILLNKFGNDRQSFKKVRFLHSLAHTLNDGYSKEVVLFFEDNQAFDLSYLTRAY